MGLTGYAWAKKRCSEDPRFAAKYREQHRASARRRYWKNRDRLCAANLAYRASHPEKISEMERRKRLRRFHLTVEQYDEILRAQDGLCALCNKPPKKSRRLAVDHDHLTGKVRGLLCDGCNLTVGRIEARDGFFIKLFVYMQRG